VKQVRFRYEVVDSIPETLQAYILYVTTDRDVAGHLCACGCGREVITPLSPTDWSISFDRRGASLSPSIGNWAFPCRAHYFIWDGVVVWACDMSDKAIQQGRRRDRARKQSYYERQTDRPPTPQDRAHAPALPLPASAADQSTGQRLLAWWKRLVAR
jgi:hypothetical protein